MTKIFIGTIYLKSGNKLPFACKKLKFEGDFTGLTSWEYNFVPYGDIPVVNFIAPSQVEAIVCEDEVEG